MTTFTTEDRIQFEKVPEPPEPTWEEKWKPWLYSLRQDYDCVQKSIEYFWPLTEQIDLGLDFEGCEKPKILFVGESAGHSFVVPTWTQNSVGQLNIGGVQIGMEKEPSWIQKLLYKLLGFDWKDMQ